MTTEAEIIPEPISVLKADEEITKPISELKKTEGGLDMPAGTDECLDKANNVELASNGVETLNTVSDSKGESFSVSPEVSKVSEKTSEGDEKMSKIEAIADHERESIEEEISHNAIESDKQEGNLELKKQDSITNPDPIIDNSNEANEIVTEAGSSGLVQEKNLEEIKDTESEKLPVLEGKAEGTEATDPIETSVSEKDQIISDSTEDILTSKAAETSDIKDHETISEIREVAEKELQNGNPHDESACVHEPAAEVAEKLEEVSKEPETDQHPIGDISNSSVSEGTVKESTKEEESIPLELTEKASSSVELEDLKKDTADPESAPATDETEEKRQETNNVAPAEECSTEDREASVVEESEKLASEPEVKEVEETKAVPTEIVSKPESKEVEETGIKAVATELASEPEVNEVEQIKAVATELASEPEVNEVEAVPRELALEPEVKEVEDTKVVATELASELKVKEVEETKAVATESASEPEVNEVEQPKTVATEFASEPEVNEVEENKAVATESALEPEVNEVEETKAVEKESASEPEVNEVEQTKAVASEPEVNEVEQTKAVASEPEVNEVEEAKAVATESALESKVNEVEQTKSAATESASEPIVNEVEETKTVATELASEPEVKEVVETKAVATELASEPEVKETEETKAVPTESASELEVKKVEQIEAVATELVLEPELKEVEETKAVPTELASELEVKEVEQTEAVATELGSEPKVNEVEQTKAVTTELAPGPEVNEVEQTKAVTTELAPGPEVNEVEQTKSVPETAQSTVKIEEEIHKDAEIVKHESAIEEAYLQKEEESEPKAVSVEETIADEGLRNEEHEAKQTGDAQASITEESKEIETSALPSEKHETTQTEETVVEAPEVKENEIIEKQMVSEDKSVQNPSQASSIMPIVEESSLESSQAKPEGTKASDNQISRETLKDDANNNVEEEIVAQEQPQVATIVPGEEAKEIEAKPEPASATSGNISLSDLLQRSEEEKNEVAERVIEESELTVSKEAAAAVEDAENIQAKEAKTDEHNKTDSGSDAPVMVEAPRDTETKPHKKSQNIVSKAISKVKKAITGKSSSNSKEQKATSPKGGDK